MSASTNMQAVEQAILNNKLAKLKAQVFGYNYDTKQLTNNMGVTKIMEGKIRSMYLLPGLHPIHFCSYAAFARVLPAPDIHQAYKTENLNIIDLHLRYHQFVHEKLSLVKWVPSLLILAATKFHPVSFVFPLIFTKAVDYYFFNFFLWKYSNHKIINIRNEFTAKMSKDRSNCFFKQLLRYSKASYTVRSIEIASCPIIDLNSHKNTHYIFHTSQKNIEQSSIYLTPLFETYMNIKNIGWSSFSEVGKNISKLITQFKQYKSIQNRKQLPIFLDRARLLKYKEINKDQIYNLSKQIQLRVRRFLEIVKYAKDGKAFMSGFTFTDMFHMNKHFDLLAPQKYNYQTNAPDLIMLYGAALTYAGLKFIIKRAIKM